jgi:prepilin-type N-terminal cleavage/methylation domain-containing protein
MLSFEIRYNSKCDAEDHLDFRRGTKKEKLNLIFGPLRGAAPGGHPISWNLSRGEKGFTIVELIIVITIILLMLAAAMPLINETIQNSQRENSLQIVTLQTRLARQMAMTNRRNYRVDYENYSLKARVSIVLLGVSASETIMSQTDLAGNMTFGKAGSPPNPETDYPTVLSRIYFNPDGTGTTAANGAGGFANGTVFIAKTGDSKSNRAITIMGATGRVKGYRYNPTLGIWNSGL